MLEGSLREGLGDSDTSGCHFLYWGHRVSPLALSSTGENPVHFGRVTVAPSASLPKCRIWIIIAVSMSPLEVGLPFSMSG